MRRPFIIIAVIIVLAGVGAAAYMYVSNKEPALTVAPGQTNLPLVGQEPATEATSTPVIPESVTPRLVRISAGPVVPGEAAVYIPAPNASSTPDTSVTFIERQSGNVYSYLTRARTLTRTSNRTVPGIQSATWLPDASRAFVRYLSGDDFSTVNTYVLPATGEAGFFLPQNLADISVTPTSILMLASGVNGTVVSVAGTGGTLAREAFSTPLSALRASFLGKSQYLAFTKPSGTLAGNAFIVDAAGRFSRLAGPHDGLVALASPSGEWVLMSYVSAGELALKLVNTVTLETIPLPVSTIADKCVWVADDSALYCGIPVNPPSGRTYPDDWYQGTVSFTDRIWKIDVAGRFAQLVLDFENEAEGPLDATALAVDAAQTVIVFVNKHDGSLWSYQL